MSSTAPKREGLSLSGYAAPTGPIGVGFWPRVFARLIDFAVHFGIVAVSGILVGILAVFIAAVTSQTYQSLIDRLGKPSAAGFLFSFLGLTGYHTLSEGLSGRSLGKLILGFVVVNEDGSPCTLRAALIRSLSYFVDSLFFGVIGYAGMQRTSTQQRYGDTWAHTLVLYKSQLKPEQQPGTSRFFLALALAVLFDVAMIMVALVTNIL